MKKQSGSIIYSPTDLIRYLASPFASWLDRYYLENPDAITPDKQTEEEELLSRTGDKHEQSVLSGYKASTSVIEIAKDNFAAAHAATLAAIKDKAPIIYQAALQDGVFAGYADFLELDTSGKYQVWDTKLALSPKPYYPIQLCCYSEMLAAATGQGMPERIGVILGNGERVEFRVEDFIHYYRHIKDSFLAMQAAFSGNMDDCPEPLPRAEHGRWTSYAEKFFLEKDHLVQVAGITVGQIKEAEGQLALRPWRAWPQPQANQFISSTMARWRNSFHRHGCSAKHSKIERRNRTRNRVTRFCRTKARTVSPWSGCVPAGRSGRCLLRHGRISVGSRRIGIPVRHLGAKRHD